MKLSVIEKLIVYLDSTASKSKMREALKMFRGVTGVFGKQIVAYLIMPFIGSFGITFIKIKKILKTHRM